MSGIVIAGTHSGCGKTTVTIGIMAALKARGLRVQPFKAGPDFIDTGLHRLASGSASRNLDIWMCGEEYVASCYNNYSSDADISVVEGVMGIYDGDNSTYKLASALRLPIVLVIDASGMAESAGAVVKGFLSCDKEGLIKGFILNRVGSKRHIDRLYKGIDNQWIIGFLPRNMEFEMPSRHLGLATVEEEPLSSESIKVLAEKTSTCLDMDRLIKTAGAGILWAEGLQLPVDCQKGFLFSNLSSSPTIAVARDRAFCFYYEDNLDILRESGAEIVSFSPLKDSAIPKADMIYLGGGYPELYAEELSWNRSMVDSIRQWSQSGMPLYAECGGMMYLSKGMYDFQGRYYEMAGVFDFQTRMNNRLSRLGYRELTLLEDCLLGQRSMRMRGHEFHYSDIINMGSCRNIYTVSNNEGSTMDSGGYLYRNTLASYVHLHFGSIRNIATTKESLWKT